MVPVKVSERDEDRLFSKHRIFHDLPTKSPYSRARIDDANVGGAFRGDENATGAAELVEVISVDRNGATTTINDNADFIVVERDLFLIRDHRRFLGLELTYLSQALSSRT